MKLKNITILILFVIIIVLSLVLLLSNFNAAAISSQTKISSQITDVK